MTVDSSQLGFDPQPNESPRDRLCRLVRHCNGWSLSNQRERLAALVARGVDPADSRAVEWKTNCGTTALGVLTFTAGSAEAAQSVHPLLQTPSKVGKAIAWLDQIGKARSAWVNYSPSGRQPQAGDLLFYATYGVDAEGHNTYNEHVEWLISTPGADFRAETGGGGRANNEMTVRPPGDIRTNANRPLKRFLDLDALSIPLLEGDSPTLQVAGGRILLDPGHGGDGPVGRSTPHGRLGARGGREKDYTLALAQAIVRRLPGAALTRSADENLSLGARVDQARRQGAAAFVSLHLDGPPQAWVHTEASPRSLALGQSLQAALGSPGPAGRAPLAVLSPAHHAPQTAACLLELGDLGDPAVEERLGRPGAIEALAARLATALGGLGRRGQGLPNLTFGPPGPDGRPQGAVTVNSRTSLAGVPLLISYRVFNEADTMAGPHTNRVILRDAGGAVLLDESRRARAMEADTQADDSITFTPPAGGAYTVTVLLNAGEMPMPEEDTSDNRSETTFTVWANSQPAPVPLVQGRVGAPTDDPRLAEMIEGEIRAQLNSAAICERLVQAADGIQLPAQEEEPPAYAGAWALQEYPNLRPGTAGDLVRAIFLVPPVRLTLDRLGEDTIRNFRALRPGELALTFTWTAPIAAATIYGVLRTPSTWGPAQSILNSGLNAGLHRFAPDLNLNLNLVGPNPSVMFTFDLAPTLRRAGITF